MAGVSTAGTRDVPAENNSGRPRSSRRSRERHRFPDLRPMGPRLFGPGADAGRRSRKYPYGAGWRGTERKQRCVKSPNSCNSRLNGSPGARGRGRGYAAPVARDGEREEAESGASCWRSRGRWPCYWRRASWLRSVSSPTLSPTHTIRRLPLALQEMVPAVWLKVKGFSPSAIAFGEAETAQAKFGRAHPNRGGTS